MHNKRTYKAEGDIRGIGLLFGVELVKDEAIYILKKSLEEVMETSIIGG